MEKIEGDQKNATKENKMPTPLYRIGPTGKVYDGKEWQEYQDRVSREGNRQK